jgi:hypothetical protein
MKSALCFIAIVSSLVTASLHSPPDFADKQAFLVHRLIDFDPDVFDRVALSDEFKYTHSLAIKRLKNDTYSRLFHSKLLLILEEIVELQSDLAMIGEYMFEHKFYERDWRNLNSFYNVSYYNNSMYFRTSFDPQATFMFEFPNDPASLDYPDVGKNCDELLSARNCIKYIASFVK